MKVNQTRSLKETQLLVPIFINNTKDQFAFDLNIDEKIVKGVNGRMYIKKTYYFEPWNLPENYSAFQP